MGFAVERLGGDLDYLPDGETGDRRNWIVSAIEGFRDHPALELTVDGDWSDYRRTPRFRVRRGERLYGASLDLGIAAAARQSLPSYQQYRDRVGGPAGTPGFQVGIPGAADLAMFTFGPAGLVRQVRPFAEALVATMREVHAAAGDEVLFQLELPVELVLLARAPRPARPPLAGLLARRVVELVRAAPAGIGFGVHLCLGDLNHRALGRLADAGPLVLLANALTDHWPAGRPLSYVHVPLAGADQPPVADAAFYRPLGGLRLGDTRLVAGFAHEAQDIETQLRIRGLIEDAAGHRVDVSTSCGLGRRSEAAALAALDRIGELLAD
jgi:hypothetical protein